MQTDISNYVQGYYANCEPYSRYVSFDYCYNYFHSCEDLTADMEKSCLTLGFFLASWGMFRGKRLLWKSVKHYQPTIEFINRIPEELRGIDVDSYASGLEVIVDLYEEINSRIRPEGNSQLILGTKVLLGVFGFVPAYDANFRKSFKQIFPYCSFGSFNKESLMCIKQFYDENPAEIDRLSDEMCTLDFSTGQKTNIHYKKAKIIDMYGWQKAFKKEETKNVFVHSAPTAAPKTLKEVYTTTHNSEKKGSRLNGTKKDVAIEMFSTERGATLEEIALEIAKRGIDEDLKVNKKTAGLWRYKLDFKVEELPGKRYRKI